MGDIIVGTSGWSYPHWSGPFYPLDLPESEWLAYYAGWFTSVEINNTFYQLPSVHTLAQWRATVPAGFEFAVKASRYITHMKKLRDPAETVPRFLERMDTLGSALGPILFQLPPRWRAAPDRLQQFLAALPDGYRYVFEFRDPSWFGPGIRALLEHAGCAFCIHEFAGEHSPLMVTANLVYVRLHGPGAAYQGSYSDSTLRGWARALGEWADAGHDVRCYFDNDDAGHAVANAARLADLLNA